MAEPTPRRWLPLLVGLVALGVLLFCCNRTINTIILHLDITHGSEAVARMHDLAGVPAVAAAGDLKVIVLDGFKQDYNSWFRMRCDEAAYAAMVSRLAGDSECTKIDSGIAEIKPSPYHSSGNSLYLNGVFYHLQSPVIYTPSPEWWTESALNGRHLTVIELTRKLGGNYRGPIRLYHLFYDPATRDLRGSIDIY